MSNYLETALFKAAALTFDDLGFFYCTQELDEDQRRAEPNLAVSVAFQGPLAGKLVLKFCEDLLPTLAANMLGEEEGAVSRELQRDALKEIANVVCGNVLPEIAGATAVFHLSPPQLLELNQIAGSEIALPTAEAQVGVDQSRADVLLFLSAESAQSSLKEPSPKELSPKEHNHDSLIDRG